MHIRPSSALRNDYPAISQLAKDSGEPIFITNKGEDDGVFMSMAAYEEREKMFRHRDKVYEAELSRLRGEPTYSAQEVHDSLEALLLAYDV
jgi:PHD/YefM family antitoxin component YafN of YafNO toxin-antitoxin module